MASDLRAAGNAALAATWVGGVCALTGDADNVKCLGLIAAFFAPQLVCNGVYPLCQQRRSIGPAGRHEGSARAGTPPRAP